MTASQLCPLCTATISQAHSVEVCEHCFAGLQVNPPVVLSTTGEFPAITDPTLSEAPLTRRTPNPDAGKASCCWCKKPKVEVKKLLSQGDYHICNECVALCADILRMELGDDFA